MEKFLSRGFAVLLVLSLVMPLGCGSHEFSEVAPIDGALFKTKVEAGGESALIFIHTGEDGETCLKVGPIVERLATACAGRLQFYHWNVRLHPDIRTVLKFKGQPLAMLFEKGRPAGFIRAYANSDAVNRALFFDLLKGYVAPDLAFAGHGGARPLAPSDFDVRVLAAERPVVLCFKNDGDLGPRTFAPQVGAMADRFGALADFYIAAPELRERCEMPAYVPGIAVFDGGQLVATHSKGTYGKAKLNEALVLSKLLLIVPESAFLFED